MLPVQRLPWKWEGAKPWVCVFSCRRVKGGEMPGGRCCPHWVSPPAPPRPAQQGFEGQWAPRCPWSSGPCQVPFARPSARPLFSFLTTVRTAFVGWQGDGKGGDAHSGSWAASRTWPPPAGQAFPVGWLVCAHWWFQVPGPLAPTWEIKEPTSSFLEPEVSHRPPYSSQRSAPPRGLLDCFQAVQRFQGEEGWWVYACWFWKDHLRFCRWKRE